MALLFQGKCQWLTRFIDAINSNGRMCLVKSKTWLATPLASSLQDLCSEHIATLTATSWYDNVISHWNRVSQYWLRQAMYIFSVHVYRYCVSSLNDYIYVMFCALFNLHWSGHPVLWIWVYMHVDDFRISLHSHMQCILLGDQLGGWHHVQVVWWFHALTSTRVYFIPYGI